MMLGNRQLVSPSCAKRDSGLSSRAGRSPTIRRSTYTLQRGMNVATRAVAAPRELSLADLKQRITLLSGSKYGHDLPLDRKAEIEALLGDLIARHSTLRPAEAVDLEGTVWNTLYTNSTGASSGQLGPVIARVTQTFKDLEGFGPPGTSNRYSNIAEFGPLAFRLNGSFKVAPEDGIRINLEFHEFQVFLGPFKVSSKEYSPGEMVGFWTVKYSDSDLRVFTTNKGNIFVLAKRAD